MRGARASGAEPGAHRPARRRQDRAARRAALDGGCCAGAPARSRPGPTPTCAAPLRCPARRHPRPRRAPSRARRVDEVLGVLGRSRCARPPDGAKLRERWQPGIDAPVKSGRADSGDIEIDLVELFTEVAGLAADLETGVAILIDDAVDLRPDDVSALCAACHEPRSRGRRWSSSERVCRTCPRCCRRRSPTRSACSRSSPRIGQLDRADADFALSPPPNGRTPVRRRRPRCALRGPERLPVLRAGLRQGRAGRRAAHGPISADVKVAAPEAEAELKLSASSARATSGPPRPSGSTCGRRAELHRGPRRCRSRRTTGYRGAPGPSCVVARRPRQLGRRRGSPVLGAAWPDRPRCRISGVICSRRPDTAPNAKVGPARVVT